MPALKKYFVFWLLAATMLVVGLVGSAYFQHGDAAPVLVTGLGSEKPMVAQGVHVGAGTSEAICDEGKFTQWLTELHITGTATGSNVAYTITIQDSIDHGDHWATVQNFSAINATTTPPAGQQRLSHQAGIIANTPVSYGTCWRVVWTVAAGATGTASLNFGVDQYRH